MKLTRPDVSETKSEHRALYVGRSQKAVAASSGVGSSKLSRRLNPEEETENPVHEVILEMIGAVESGQPEIAKGVLGMITRHAILLGVADREALDIVKAASEKLAAITELEIEQMSDDERTLLIADVSQLESVASWVKSTAIRIRTERGVRRTGIELNGEVPNGRGRREAAGSR